jgi:hypothetical protein
MTNPPFLQRVDLDEIAADLRTCRLSPEDGQKPETNRSGFRQEE